MMADPIIKGSKIAVAPDCVFGDDVVIEADELAIGPGCRIGFSDGDDFRTPGGVRIKARRLVLGAGVTLGRALRIEGGDLALGDGVKIHRNGTIRVLDELRLGAFGTVGEGCEVMGRRVSIGQEFWILSHVKIGGGSAFEKYSRLDAGHYLHVGMHALINTARPVRIGDEVGLGTRTSIYTHGAYPSRLMGFPVDFAPVSIGDFSWLPGAIVNPGVTIGKHCVIGVNSLVTRDVPDGCLAGGSPARVLRERCYPRPLDPAERMAFYCSFLASYAVMHGGEFSQDDAARLAIVDAPAVVIAASAVPLDRLPAGIPDRPRTMLLADGASTLAADGSWTLADTATKRIRGAADTTSGTLINELRRHGIRFYSRGRGGRFEDWA